jgi:hypothetical protein
LCGTALALGLWPPETRASEPLDQPRNAGYYELHVALALGTALGATGLKLLAADLPAGPPGAHSLRTTT